MLTEYSIKISKTSFFFFEGILKKITPSVKRFTVKQLEERVSKSEKAVQEDRVFTTDELKERLGL